MLTYGFRPWLKNVVVFLTVNPTDFLIRNSGDFTVPSKEKSETRFVSLITPEMLSRCLRQKEDLNLNQVADQRFSLKQWFAAGVRKTGSAHFFKGFPRQNNSSLIRHRDKTLDLKKSWLNIIYLIRLENQPVQDVLRALWINERDMQPTKNFETHNWGRLWCTEIIRLCNSIRRVRMNWSLVWTRAH